MYCMPVIKRREDRDALRKAATSGQSCYFLGTDSAPHPVTRKLNTVGAAGLFNSPVAIESYAQVFAEENALDKLEAFASLNGPKHYRLPVNSETITLERTILDRTRRRQRSTDPRSARSSIAAARPSSGKSSLSRSDGIENMPASFADKKTIAELTAKMLLEIEAVQLLRPRSRSSSPPVWRAPSTPIAAGRSRFRACATR